MQKTFFFLSILILTISSRMFSQPKFSIVGGNSFDFGTLYHGKAKKMLVIKNDGTETLTLSNISSSCGCTGALASSDKIAPGDSGKLEITFDTHKVKGGATKAVSMETNDPKNQKVRITFTANVIAILDLLPEYLYFQGKEGGSLSDEVTLKNTGSNPITILSATPSTDNITATIKESQLNPGRETTLTCVFTPKGKGVVKGNIILKTDNPNLPEI